MLGRRSVPGASQRWIERRRRQRRSPLRRQLEQSFPLRLLLAFTAAFLALAAVNRWEQCRDGSMAPGCLLRDAGGVISVDNLEALSIVTAGFLFILEGGQRRQREHVEAMDLILSCQQAGVRFSHARNEALERLSAAGLGLDGLQLNGIDLDELQVPGARWPGVNLAGSSLRDAVLRGADLRGANLTGSDLSGADLSDADLSGADLRGATLERARLTGATLEGASLDDRSSAGAV